MKQKSIKFFIAASDAIINKNVFAKYIYTKAK